MGYLRLLRGRLILLSFAISSLLFVLFPAIDLGISRMLFDDGLFLPANWATFAHDSVPYFLGVSLSSISGLYLYNRVFGRGLCGIDGKRVSYLLLVLVLGAGLVVNGILKDDFGRARPRDVEEFGGSKHFTPAFVISQECDDNCSFSSGDGAGAFFALALALALGRKRAVLVAAVSYGVVVSSSRVATGAHFFSDSVVSFFVMLISADVLFHYLVLPEAEPAPAAAWRTCPPLPD
jgi:lipid A 4'-phosphatase